MAKQKQAHTYRVTVKLRGAHHDESYTLDALDADEARELVAHDYALSGAQCAEIHATEIDHEYDEALANLDAALRSQGGRS